MQLDKHTVGYLTYKAGLQNAMSTMLVRDTPRLRTAVSIQFGILNSYASISVVYKMEEKKLKLQGSLRSVSMIVAVD